MVCPARIGVVIGIVTNTPVLLILVLRPLKNLFAAGSQILTGQERSIRASLRCSIKVSIVYISFNGPSIYKFIGNVNLDRLVYLGKIVVFLRNFCLLLCSFFFCIFYRAFRLQDAVQGGLLVGI